MKRARLLSSYVPWQDYVADDMLQLTSGRGMLMMLRLDGLPFETVDIFRIVNRHRHYERGLRGVAQDGLTFHVLQCRGTVDPSIYPVGRFRTEFARGLDRRYRAQLFEHNAMWLNRTYLAIQLGPGRSGIASMLRRVKAADPEAMMARLRNIVDILTEELRDYAPTVLGISERDGLLFSEIAEAVAFAMTGHWRPVPLTTSGAAAIFSEEFHVGPERFEVRMPDRSAWGACLEMQDFPYVTTPMMFDRFLSANYRHTVYHGLECLSATEGEAVLTRKQNRMRAAGDRALSQAADLTAAADAVAGNRMFMGSSAFALTLFTADPAALPDVIRKGWSDLSSGGLKVARANRSLEAVLFSMIPGNFHLRGRQAAISSRNFAAFAAMHNFPSGEKRGFWGDPVTLFRTSGGTPYYYHFQYDGSGNTFASGQTRSGKTVWLGLMICQAERAGAQVILWDKDRGLEALVRALDGSYLSLTNRPGIGSGLAPLKRLSDGPDDLAFLSGLIRACIATPQSYDLTPEEDRRLGIGLRHIMAAPAEDRDLDGVRAFLGTARDGAGARLEKWCQGGEFGWVIDGETDIVSLDGRVIAFDQSQILDDPIAAGAVMATLFHYTGQLVDGRRLLFVLDEVWKALDIPQFHGQIKNGLKTWGKYNSPLLIATQDVSDGLNSPIGDTIRTQTPNQVHFANPGAADRDYGADGMRLTETEIDVIRTLPKGIGMFLLKQGDRSVVLQAKLAPEDVQVISGTRKGRDAIEATLARDPQASGVAFVHAYRKAMEEAPA